MYIIKEISTGNYIENYRFETTDNLQKARVFKRRCDAMNSIVQGYRKYKSNYEIVKVTLIF